MSDFSELCPLFNTGVFSEVTFPRIIATASSDTCNLLEGLITAGAESREGFTFGRTVVVTKAWIKKWTANAEIMYLHLKHYTSLSATPTIFGSWTISNTITLEAIKHHWKEPTTITDKTFTSDEVLGLSIQCGTTSSGGEYDMIVQYKEK